MDNVINIVERLNALNPTGGMAYERFLIDEGLELLAAYRAIDDVDTRVAVLQLVKRIGLEKLAGAQAGR